MVVRSLLVLAVSALASVALAAPASASCAMCPEDLGSDPGARVLVVLPHDGSVPAEVPCLVGMGYRAFPVVDPAGPVALDVLAGDFVLCVEELLVAAPV